MNTPNPLPTGKTPRKAKTRTSGALGRAVAFITVFCILASLAIVRNHSLFGHDLTAPASAEAASDSVPAMTVNGATEIINTTSLAKDVSGYTGPVPVQIFVTNGVIDSIASLPNQETPGFFGRLEKSGLTSAWNGLTLAQADTLQVDAVSGATFSSTAYIANVRAGIDYVIGASSSRHSSGPVSAGVIAAIVVIVMGAVIPLFVHNPSYRIVQQLLNVAVLGFWAGTFIDYAMMLKFFASAPVPTLAFLTTLLLLVVGLVYPLFGKPNHYCTWVCPFGSLQDLAGHLNKRKWHLLPGLVKILDNVRQALWTVLLVLLYAGVGTSWIDYEIFTGFIVESASVVVIVIGIAFIALSLFVTRPFCRFVCPTGAILKDA